MKLTGRPGIVIHDRPVDICNANIGEMHTSVTCKVL